MELTVYFDYQCPYSYRVAAWLAPLTSSLVRPRYRFFSLEQVNRDPAAAEWRIWDQPLDYRHHRGRSERRSLAAFLATALLEAVEAPEVVDAFRLAVFRARFDEGADISDPDLLSRLAARAGAGDALPAGVWTREEHLEPARRRLAADWAEARRRYQTFGVPTLDFGDGNPPIYLRLSRMLNEDEGRWFFQELASFRQRAPYVAEIKVPEPVGALERGAGTRTTPPAGELPDALPAAG
jgi:2-hydroxychromene-2-carboxylate isomerase